MKKPLFLILLLCLAVSLAACTGIKPAAPDPSTPTETVENTENAEATEPTETTETTEPASAIPEETEASADETEPAPGTTQPEETDAPDLSPAVITLAWVEDYEGDINALSQFSAVSEPQTGILIYTDKTVTGLQILSLTDPDIHDDGTLGFTEEAVFTLETLSPDAPLYVRTTFYGDMPNLGVRYTDADGTEKTFAIDISGRDGSLYLLDYVNGGAA